MADLNWIKTETILVILNWQKLIITKVVLLWAETLLIIHLYRLCANWSASAAGAATLGTGLVSVVQLGRSGYREALVADADPRLIWRKIVHSSVNILVDHLTCRQEGLLNIISGLGTSFHENQPVLFGKSLTFFRADLSAGIEITFIANKHDDHIGVAVLSDFFKPSCQVSKGIPSSYVVDKEGTRSATVVAPGNTFERLLAGGIPDL